MPDNPIPKRSLDPVGMEIYRGWLQVGLSPIEAYNKLVATKKMAGSNVTVSVDAIQAQIDAFRAEVTTQMEAQSDVLRAQIETQGAELGAKIETQGAELGAKIEANAAELRSQRSELKSHHKITWALVGILAAAVFGLLTAVFFRPQPAPAPQSPPIVILGFPQASVVGATPVNVGSPQAGESPDSTDGR